MYIVTIQNGNTYKVIHDNFEKLTSGKITKGINAIDSFQFSMLPSNVGFDLIHDYTTLVTVYNTFKERYEFFGRVLYSDDEMSESGLITKEVICESYLGFLCDSQQIYVEEKNWTVLGLFTHIINTHNSLVETHKQIYIGEVTVTDPNDNLYCGIQRENTWETIKKKLIDVLGGEIRFRVVGSKIYLDYLTEIGSTSTTEIALSKNMKSIVKETDPSEIVTRLIPLGCKLEAEGEDGEKEETEYRLDISSVNNGKIYIDDENAIALYGIRVKTVEFDEVTVASTLMKKGENWLAVNNKIRIGYTINALDLSLIGLDVDDFEVYNYHLIKNPLLGIEEFARIIKKSIDICDELKSTIEFGDNFEKLSETMKRQSDNLNLVTKNYVTNKKFESTINKTTTLIEQTEEKIRLEVKGDYDNLTKSVMAELDLKVGKDENDQIVSMLNASANVITINSNRLIINSDNFSLTADGTITAKKGVLGGGTYNWSITSDGTDSSICFGTDNRASMRGNFSNRVRKAYMGTNGISLSTEDLDNGTTIIAANDIMMYGWNTVGGNPYSTISINPWGLTFTAGSSAPSTSFMSDDTEIGKIIASYSDNAMLLNGNWKVSGTMLNSSGSSVITSDANQKNSIETLDDRYSQLFDLLSVKRFKYNCGTSDRYHLGLIAQELKEAIDTVGITEKEFAALCYENIGKENESWGIRYGELIPLCIQEIQRLKSKIAELERG